MGTKKAIIVFFGKPNVGKSTLFNALQSNVTAITSYKPQTTRNNIFAIINFNNEHQAAIVDTPGFHIPHNKLDLFLNQEIKEALKNATVACFLFDNTRDFDEEDAKVLKFLSMFEIKTKILIINKIDKAPSVNPKNEQELKTYHFDHELKISATQQQNIDTLIELLKKQCVNEDLNIDTFNLPSDEFIATEAIRLACIHNLNKELPYAIGVELNNYTYNKETNILDIDANILVEKESQKPIVIGKKARSIKKIGMEARKSLLDIYDCKINLKLFVKVKNDWRNNDYVIKSLGYKH